MRFIKDTEKEQLKRLVKACMLEISKLKMDLKKCREGNHNSNLQQLNLEVDTNSKQVKKLEKLLKEKENEISDFKLMIEEKNKQIRELERIKSYFEALTAKPKRDLTSFQSQIYQLLPNKKANTKKIHFYIQKVGFKELTIDNMSHILHNLERKGYVSSEKVDDEIIWEKIEK